jgi:hypothetical protein
VPNISELTFWFDFEVEQVMKRADNYRTFCQETSAMVRGAMRGVFTSHPNRHSERRSTVEVSALPLDLDLPVLTDGNEEV